MHFNLLLWKIEGLKWKAKWIFQAIVSAKLEKEKEELKESLESTQAEVEGLKEQARVTRGNIESNNQQDGQTKGIRT